MFSEGYIHKKSFCLDYDLRFSKDKSTLAQSTTKIIPNHKMVLFKRSFEYGTCKEYNRGSKEIKSYNMPNFKKRQKKFLYNKQRS